MQCEVLTDCVTLQEVSTDNLLSDVLHFPSGTDLHDHPLVQSACLILQVDLCAVYTLFRHLSLLSCSIMKG